MTEYIDREALLAHIKDVPTWIPDYDPTSDGHTATHYPDGMYYPEDVISSIENRPAADVVPVRHGRWIATGEWDKDLNYYYQCSACGHGDWHSGNVDVPYCWHCGAKMDGEVDK